MREKEKIINKISDIIIELIDLSKEGIDFTDLQGAVLCQSLIIYEMVKDGT